MTITTFAKIAKIAVLTPLSAAILGTLGSSAVAAADPLPYGPNTCIDGFVWREASQYDETCVTPDTRSDTSAQNSLAAQNREPNGGAYGPDTCKQGFVWRDAFAGDHVCVTPDVRAQAATDNAAASTRLVVNQPATGTVPHPPGPFYPGSNVLPTSPTDPIRDVFGALNPVPLAPITIGGVFGGLAG